MYLNFSREKLFQYTWGLTLTWDVFKFSNFNLFICLSCWLRLTWDVFKFVNDIANAVLAGTD